MILELKIPKGLDNSTQSQRGLTSLNTEQNYCKKTKVIVSISFSCILIISFKISPKVYEQLCSEEIERATQCYTDDLYSIRSDLFVLCFSKLFHIE